MGEWLALAAILPILFLGPSWDDLLFPFQMALFGSVACGIAALLALERRDRTGDLVAMGLLLLGLLFSDLGIPFVAGATVELAFDRDRWRRAWSSSFPPRSGCSGTPGGATRRRPSSPSPTSPDRPTTSSTGSERASRPGSGSGPSAYDASPLDWGRPLLVLALGLAAWRLYVLRRPSPRLLGTAVILLGFWFLTALNTNPFAPATAGRYQYIGIVLMALLAAELAAGLRVRRYATVALVLLGAAAAMVNGVQAPGRRPRARRNRRRRSAAASAALELTRGRVDPRFELTEENSDVDYLELLDAGSYFSAVDAYGSPAYTPAELASASEAARVAADKVFAAALGVALRPGPAGRPRKLRRASARLRSPPVVQVPPEGIVLRASLDPDPRSPCGATPPRSR